MTTLGKRRSPPLHAASSTRVCAESGLPFGACLITCVMQRTEAERARVEPLVAKEAGFDLLLGFENENSAAGN